MVFVTGLEGVTEVLVATHCCPTTFPGVLVAVPGSWGSFSYLLFQASKTDS